jgi:flagellar biosynthetic protein FlhB
MADNSSRTEKPTQRRLEKARQEGQFVTSREFVGAVQFLAFISLLVAGAAGWIYHFLQVMRYVLAYPFRAGDVRPAPVMRTLFLETFVPLIVGGGVIVACTLGVHLGLTRLGLSWKKLRPDWKKLSPANRLRQLPRQNLVALFQASLVLVFFGGIVSWLIWNNAAAYAMLPLTGVEAGVAYVGESIGGLLWKASAVLLAVGIIDLLRQRHSYTADLRMSKQEIQDEVKETEGNPLVKARVRRLQRDLRRRRMMAQVPTATAVVVNPTHYAVALKYLPDSMPAPVVVAKGKNYLAQLIKQKAIDHKVPIVENPPVAQALYRSVEVGQEIPPQLYRAVAEILAYIHRLMHARR